MAGEIYISNIAGTFDYQQILDAYYQAQIQPILLLQSQESTLDKKISALQSFASKIDDIYNAFNTLTSSTLLDEKQVVVSNENVLTATITDSATAIEGNVTVDVKQLAKNDIWLSQAGVADLSSAVATVDGTIQISYAGSVVATIDYDTNTSDSTKPSTLQEIATAINSAQSVVKASVIFDGSNYRLLLSGTDTGSSNVISIDETGTGDLLDQLQLGTNYTTSHVQTAQDAVVSIYGSDISSSTNTFSNAIPGVQFTVKQENTSATISVEKNYQPFKDALDQFISSYNALVDFVQTEGGKDGSLSGETTLQFIRSGILSRMQPLLNLGIFSVDKDTGHISVDTTKLDDMLNNSPTTVSQAISDLKTSLYDYLLYLKDPRGPVESKETSLNNQKTLLEDQIGNMQKLINSQIELFKQQLIQVQLLQEEMNQIKAKLTSTFGTTSILPSN
ncbi:flagellar filament capping protein FliD [Desulfurobacterium thermolithotrophum]|uniref:flagellar filament capping protein FliD n=1 Tax=Desulfurobacterium thermolithotrophum TaxID=64160 RepID=UPI0013D75523|nr:flagellar filament capping protein FliD [Desulfurobacterium thermolithotrophum]